MEVWLPALTGTRSSPDRQSRDNWVGCRSLKYNLEEDTVKILFKGKPYTVHLRHLREGRCSQCGQWCPVTNLRDQWRSYCSTTCEEAAEVRLGMRKT